MSHRPLSGGDMDRVSDEVLHNLIEASWVISGLCDNRSTYLCVKKALTELRDRRQAEKTIDKAGA